MSIEVKKISKTLPKYLQKRLPHKVAVISISEKRVRELNAQYRKKHRSTNVLSFRYGPKYGEILVCPAVIRREAKIAGHRYKYQMTWMVLHGMIHLSGLHHEGSAQLARRVARMEQRILNKMFSVSKS